MKKWTIREYAKYKGVEIIGSLVRYPEYEYDGETKVYADDRVDTEDCICFGILNGQVTIDSYDGSIHFDSSEEE